MTSLEEILKSIVHPELNKNIVELGMVSSMKELHNEVFITLQLLKAPDPSISSVRRAIERSIVEQLNKKVHIIVKEPLPNKVSNDNNTTNKKGLSNSKTIKTTTNSSQLNVNTSSIKKIIAISSCKGGVGKSFVTANLAIALKKRGYKVGILDADIYGPSMPIMFGLTDYTPLTDVDNKELILPAEKYDIKINSIGFFIKSDYALIWRGPMASSALKQLVNQTKWGELDYLLLDLPPGTGDIHLTIINELKIDTAIIVTTPQIVALADVIRGISMFNSENINVPIAGIVENMAYFTPADNDESSDTPKKKYYIFGQNKVEDIVIKSKTKLLASIPIDETVAQNDQEGIPYMENNENSVVCDAINKLADAII